MGLSINTYPYAGGIQTFPVNFALGFLKREDVQVYVEGDFDGTGDQIYQDFTWNNDSEVLVTNPLTIGDNVVVVRTVSKETLVVNFNTEGSATRRNIQFGLQQAMMAMHEFMDGRVESIEEVYPFNEYIEQITALYLSSVDLAGEAGDAADRAELAAASSDTAGLVAGAPIDFRTFLQVHDAVQDLDNDLTQAIVDLTLDTASPSDYISNTPAKVLTTNEVWSSAEEVSLTDAAIIAIDMNTFINATITLEGNRSLGNPSNAKVGQYGRIRVVQDATGSRTLSYGDNFILSGDKVPTLKTDANAEDYLHYSVVSPTKILLSKF